MKFFTKSQEIEAKSLESAQKKLTKLLGDRDFMVYDSDGNLIAERRSYSVKRKWRIISENERKMYRPDLQTLCN